MAEPLLVNALLAAAVATSCVGMGWLALSMEAHARQAWGWLPRATALRRLRSLGAGALCMALALCLYADHASMAVLVWVMASSGGALLSALLLATRPHWMRWLAPWVRQPPDAEQR